MNTDNPGFVFTTISGSQEETFNLGKTIGSLCKGGEIIAQSGELGAGKTLLTKGIGVGLGITANILSPTFMLVRTYAGSKLKLNHFDFYRLDSPDDLYSTGFEDYLDSDTVTVIEWAEKFYEDIPKPYLIISISVIDENSRKITIETAGSMPEFEKQFKAKE